jgi:MSHA pilin protein MshA
VNKAIQGGFTLIELVVVITILGILAAFAVPRFASLEGEARLAATQSLAGSIRSGASLAHALWLAEGPSDPDVVMEGQTIAIVNGYPDAASIDDTLVEYAGFALTWTASTATFTKQNAAGTSTITDCSVTYTQPAAANQPPTVAAMTTGC